MVLHERPDVVAYREYFLLQVQQAERDGIILVFGDGASICIKERESYCWHAAGEHLYPLHESEGEALGIHLWGSGSRLLLPSLDIWDIQHDGANNHERFLQQCEVVLKAFEDQNPGKKGLFIYDNGRYAKKYEFVLSGKRKAELVEWAENHHLNSQGTVPEIKGRIKVSQVYHERLTMVQQYFQSRGHQLLHLPPCHPEYNMMELVWSQVKRHCNEYGDFTKRRMCHACRATSIGPDMCQKLARHCHQNMESHWTRFKQRKWGARSIKRRKLELEGGK